MKRRYVLLALATLALTAVQASRVVASGTASYTVIEPAAPLAFGFRLGNGINNLGAAVGVQSNAAALWENGATTILPILGANPNGSTVAQALAINGSGQVAGLSSSPEGLRAVRWENGSVTGLGVLGPDPNGTSTSRANAINRLGQVVGESSSPVGARAFLWENGAMSDLGTVDGTGFSQAYGINGSGQVVGRALFSGNLHACVWENGGVTDIGPARQNSEARAINEAGLIVGGATTLFGLRAMLWQNGAMINLGALYTDPSTGAGSSMALAINSSGQVVGRSHYTSPSQQNHAFLWQDANGNGASDPGEMVDLNSVIPGDSGWILVEANGINDQGQIVGTGSFNGLTRAFLLTPTNRPPVIAQPLSFETDEDVPLYRAAPGLLQSVTDADGDPLTAVKVSDPEHGTLTLNADGSFSYAPFRDFHGSDSFTFKVNDGKIDSAVGTVQISVLPVNDPPVLTYPFLDYSLLEDRTLQTSVGGGVLRNGFDADGDPLTARNVTGPFFGTLTLNPDGSFIYTPFRDFNGTDRFTYTLNDGTADSAVGTVRLDVFAVNDAPAAVFDSAYAELNTAVTVPVLDNDIDVDGDRLTVVSVSQPSAGSATTDGTTVTYTPTNGYTGTDQFHYTISDGRLTATAYVQISVTTANQPPRAVTDIVQTALDTPVVIDVLANDVDPNSDPLSITGAGVAKNGAVSLSADRTRVTYTPFPGFRGRDTFLYGVSDGRGGFAFGRVYVTVR